MRGGCELTILLFMESWSHRIGKATTYVAFYIEMQNRSTIGKVLNYAAEHNIQVSDFDVENDCDPTMPSKASGKFSFNISSARSIAFVRDEISAIDGVISVYKI